MAAPVIGGTVRDTAVLLVRPAHRVYGSHEVHQHHLPGAIDWYNLAITLYRLAIGMTGTMTFFLLARPVYGFLSKFSFMPLLCRGLTPLHL